MEKLNIEKKAKTFLGITQFPQTQIKIDGKFMSSS